MRIEHWPPDIIEQRWPEISGYVAAAMEYAHGEFLLLDMYELLLAGFYQLDVVLDGDRVVAACGRKFRPKFRIKLLSVELCGGENMAAWMPAYMEYLLDLARQNGAKRLECTGRPGWARALSKLFPGFVKTKTVTLIAEVDDAQLQS